MNMVKSIHNHSVELETAYVRLLIVVDVMNIYRYSSSDIQGTLHACMCSASTYFVLHVYVEISAVQELLHNGRVPPFCSFVQSSEAVL